MVYLGRQSRGSDEHNLPTSTIRCSSADHTPDKNCKRQFLVGFGRHLAHPIGLVSTGNMGKLYVKKDVTAALAARQRGPTVEDAGSSALVGSLSNIKLLQTVDPSTLKALEQQCTWRRWKKGEEILNRDSADRDVFFVVSGTVRIVNFSLSGREVAYAQVGEGNYFGEMSAIDGEPRSAAVTALQDSLLASLAPNLFRDLLKAHPEAAMDVVEKLAKIVRVCDDRIMDLATLSAYQRVYGELLTMKKEDPITPNSWLIYPVPTQAQIAANASTTRETVARVLSQLNNAGITERKSKTIYIRDLEKLTKLAERTDANAQDQKS